MVNRLGIQGEFIVRESMAEGVASDVGEGLVFVFRAVNGGSGSSGKASRTDWRTHAVQTPRVFQLISSPQCRETGGFFLPKVGGEFLCY